MPKSWLRFPGLLGAFVMVLALTAPAQADVDWSQYIDRDAKPTARDSSFDTAPKAKSTRTTRARATKKVAKAKVRARTKSKRKARRK